MKTIANLPDEILCNVFFLATQMGSISPKIFKTGNDFKDCVALIDISQVCRRWRDVALANPTLWSSLHIDLHDPSAKTLLKVAYFAKVCFARSRDLPLICAISISHLDNFRLAHPLLLALVAHEARWSQIAINLTRPRRQVTPFPVLPEMYRDTSGDYDIHLNDPGAGFLKEFQLNLQSWFSYSMTNPFQRLETLRIAHSDLLVLDDAQGTIAKWLPLAPNLTELEITKDDSRVSFAAVQHKVRLERKARLFRPPVLLPKLRVLLASPTLLPKLTCPALEKYILNYSFWPTAQQNFLDFVERCEPPLRALEVRNWKARDESIRGFLIRRITSLAVVCPGEDLIKVLSQSSEGVEGFSVLPALEHLELSEFDNTYFNRISTLITTRWNVAVAAHRSLKSVNISRCFDSVPFFVRLSSTPSFKLFGRQQLEIISRDTTDKWRVLAQCALEGLEFFGEVF